MSNNEKSIFSKALLFSIIVLVVILTGSIVTAFYPLVRGEMHPTIEGKEHYTALELAGRDIYQREGCLTCHSQTVRPLKSEVLRYGDYSKGGESAGERPFLWGSRRTGPDLARIGGKYPDEWHYQHMVNPQKFAQKSNMPKYPWLETTKVNAAATAKHMKAFGLTYTDDEINKLADKTELEAITAYLQVIGKAVTKLNLVEITSDDYAMHGNPAEGKPGAAEYGRTLFVSECSGCHGLQAEGNIGMPLEGYGYAMDEEWAFLTVANGFEGLMPGFANVMTREQIGSLVEYLKTLH